jgi:integrase
MNRKRRGRGEGGIRYREDKKLWVVEVRTGGGQKRRSVYGKSKSEVQKKLRQMHQDIAAGVSADAVTLTLSQFFERWLENIKPTVEPNTHCYYERMLRLHVAPHIGGVKLAKFGKAHVRGLYAALSASGVSAAMQRKIGTTLTIALNAAVNDDLLPSNPAKKVRKPKATKQEMCPLDPNQVTAFLNAASHDRLFALYRTALDSGARPGELLALEWPDVDLEGRFLTNQ